MFVPSVAVRLYRPVALALEAHGIDADAVFAEFGVPAPGTSGWDVRVPLPQIAGIWDRLLAVTGDPRFALHAAEHVDLTTCDVITYLEANAESVRDALQKKFEYLPLMTNAIAWTLEVAGDEAILALHERPQRPPLAPVAEYLTASRHIFFRQFGPPNWRLSFVSFRHSAPSETSEFSRIFGVTPRFEAAQDQLGFTASLLDSPMRQRDDSLTDLLLRYAEHALGTIPSSRTLSDRVREVLRPGIDPGITEVARRLAVSARSLQRALKSEGTSYLEISNRVRRDAAERLLLRRELAVAEVAFGLGFSDVPAFHRAFLRWTGSTPGEFRMRKLGNVFAEPVFGRLLHSAKWPDAAMAPQPASTVAREDKTMAPSNKAVPRDLL